MTDTAILGVIGSKAYVDSNTRDKVRKKNHAARHSHRVKPEGGKQPPQMIADSKQINQSDTKFWRRKNGN